jgi:hypothetical protein
VPSRSGRNWNGARTQLVNLPFLVYHIKFCKGEGEMSRLKLLRDQRQLAQSKFEGLPEDHPLRSRYLEWLRELDQQIEALT